jgi:hypothetical protein
MVFVQLAPFATVPQLWTEGEIVQLAGRLAVKFTARAVALPVLLAVRFTLKVSLTAMAMELEV